VLGERASENRAADIVPGQEEVDEGLLKMDRPGGGLVPGPGGAVEGERRDGFFEQVVQGFGIGRSEVGQVQVIVDVEVGEIGPRDQSVAAADKVCSHLQSAGGVGTGRYHEDTVTGGAEPGNPGRGWNSPDKPRGER
jgi:hypothetical protein